MIFLVLLIFAVVGLCYFWLEKLVELMLLEDRDFPGRFDKILWFIVFMLAAPIAPFAFRIWKSARTAEHASSLS